MEINNALNSKSLSMSVIINLNLEVFLIIVQHLLIVNYLYLEAENKLTKIKIFGVYRLMLLICQRKESNMKKQLIFLIKQ
jgi:hypothetical protein